MKIMKVKFNPKTLAQNPALSYDSYAQKVIKAIKREAVVDKSSFFAELKELGDSFVRQDAKEQMNKKSKWFAETLVALKSNDLAGIVYSYLVKLNYGSPKLREEFATRALAIAKRTNDPIHIMARANDLKEVYKITAHGTEKHLRVLYQEKRALNDIISNYDIYKSNKSRSISREMRPIDGYLQKLADIKIEIAEMLLKKNPELAQKELIEAKNIYSKFGEGKNTQKIEHLLSKLS